MKNNKIASMIDHTNLKAEATPDDINKLCEDSLKYNFAAVCVNPIYVAQAARKLKKSKTKICTVIGFPLGASTTNVKITEAIDAIGRGADEIDMVIPIGLLKAGKINDVRNDIEQIMRAVHSNGGIIKVILETCYLTDDEIILASQICQELEVDFIKTSTGFGTAGASLEHIHLIKENCGSKIKIKASGGIRTKEDAQAFIKAGVDRLGTSNSVAIVEDE